MMTLAALTPSSLPCFRGEKKAGMMREVYFGIRKLGKTAVSFLERGGKGDR